MIYVCMFVLVCIDYTQNWFPIYIYIYISSYSFNFYLIELCPKKCLTPCYNSDDHYIYYCGQESLRRNGVAIIVNKRVWNAILRCNLKNDRMISVHFQGKPFTIKVIELYARLVMLKKLKLNGSMKTYKTF